jgi:hypothetical protein
MLSADNVSCGVQRASCGEYKLSFFAFEERFLISGLSLVPRPCALVPQYGSCMYIMRDIALCFIALTVFFFMQDDRGSFYWIHLQIAGHQDHASPPLQTRSGMSYIFVTSQFLRKDPTLVTFVVGMYANYLQLSVEGLKLPFQVYSVAVSAFLGGSKPSRSGNVRGDVAINFSCDPDSAWKLVSISRLM